jgi:hypothetical protein
LKLLIKCLESCCIISLATISARDLGETSRDVLRVVTLSKKTESLLDERNPLINSLGLNVETAQV